MNHYLSSTLVRIARVAVVATLLVMSIHVASAAQQQAADADLLVYHQITDLGEDHLSGVGAPVLSADGTTAVFSDAPGSGDTINPNRIFTINADGSGQTEVDSYQTHCYCGALLDISADGSVVVSSESMQLRVATGGSAEELVSLASNELGPIRLTADGETVYFIIRRDTSTYDGQSAMAKGVWAIDTDGDNLRHVVAFDAVAEVAELPATDVPNYCCFYGDGIPLGISDDGGRITFGSYGVGGEFVYAADGDGENLHQVAGPFNNVKNAALSGDGSLIAYDVVLADGNNQIGVVDFAGEDSRDIATNVGSGFYDRLHLTPDGSQLLITPASLLVDTATGDRRQLAVLTPGGPGQTAVLAEGMARASMNDAADKFLYVMSYTRCADCANQHEQLATLDIGPADLGDAPTISDANVTPDEIPLNTPFEDFATITATVDTTGEVVAVGAVALLDGLPDPNVARNGFMLDDGLNGDTRANDDLYTCKQGNHLPVVVREDDTGPRVLLVQAEIVAPDGFHHATAIEVGEITVVAAT